MDSKILVIITVSYLYGFFEVFMNLRQRRKNNAITTEEKFMSEQLGKDYLIYQEHTKKIIPLLY